MPSICVSNSLRIGIDSGPGYWRSRHVAIRPEDKMVFRSDRFPALPVFARPPVRLLDQERSDRARVVHERMGGNRMEHPGVDYILAGRLLGRTIE